MSNPRTLMLFNSFRQYQVPTAVRTLFQEVLASNSLTAYNSLEHSLVGNKVSFVYCYPKANHNKDYSVVKTFKVGPTLSGSLSFVSLAQFFYPPKYSQPNLIANTDRMCQPLSLSRHFPPTRHTKFPSGS